MLKRLPYLILALLVGISSSVLFGGKVRAAAPIFYDGTCEFAIGRRSFMDSVDFNYIKQGFTLPLLGDMAIVDSNAWGLPSAFSGVTYTKVPMYFSCTCPDVVRNGGYIYFSFMVAYWDGTGITGVTRANGRRSHAFLSYPGSLEYALANGIDLGAPALATSVTDANTVLINPTPAATGNEVLHVTELNMPSGSNFPKVALFDLDDDKGTLRAYGLDDAYLLGYGETSDSSWMKGSVWTYRIEVTPRSVITNNYTIWVDLSNTMLGTFTPVSFSGYNLQTNAGIYFIQSTLSGSMSNLVYMCPVSCFAISSDSFDSVESYLSSIDNKLSGLIGIGDSVNPGVLESYAAMASEARAAAEQAVRDMSIAAPTFGTIDPDIFGQVDTQAKNQFITLLSFLRLDKILPIVLAVFVLSLIAYVFFGKKG